MKQHGRALLLAALGCLLACGVLTSCRFPIVASDYKQTCVDDRDCVAVYVGDTCNDCEAAAIHVEARQHYDDAHLAPCPLNLRHLFFGPVVCPETEEGFCNSGTCAWRIAAIK